MDGEKRQSNKWGNTKVINWMGQQKGNEKYGEKQRELNGWGNRMGIEWMGKHKRNRMDGETQR